MSYFLQHTQDTGANLKALASIRVTTTKVAWVDRNTDLPKS